MNFGKIQENDKCGCGREKVLANFTWEKKSVFTQISLPKIYKQLHL